MLAKVVQRGILLRERDASAERREALVLRNPNGTWELPGGKIEHGESARKSLEREVREETGLAVTEAEPVETTVRRLTNGNRGKFAVVYRCAFETGAVELSDEHVAFDWRTAPEIAETNLKQVDEYRSLRRVMRGATREHPDDEPAIRVAQLDGSTNGDGSGR